MHASTAFIAAFAALATAAPAYKNPLDPSSDTVYENINISDFTVRKDQAAGSSNKTIQSVSFKLSGDEADDLLCEASKPDFPSEVITCGDSPYRFVLKEGSSDAYEFGLTLYHEIDTAVGYWGEGNVPTYCRAGGNGQNDFICTEVGLTTIVITNGAK